MPVKKRHKITISVGIPAYNEAANIQHLIQNLLSQKTKRTILHEIIVVSDGSTDDTVKSVLAFEDPRVRCHKLSKRQGQAIAQNRIIKTFSGDVLVMLNADVLPASDYFLEEIAKPFATDDRLGLVTPAVLPLTPETWVEKILHQSILMKKDLFEQWHHGQNMYTCVGRARAFSREFAKKITWPKVTAEDAYSYLWNYSLGYHYLYLSSTSVYYRLPQTVHDHIKQSARFMTGPQELYSHFPPALVDYHYALPLMSKVMTTLRHSIQNPVSVMSYIALFAYIKFGIDKQKYLSSRWSISETSKRLFHHPEDKHILIANATGPTNIGDQAMLQTLLDLLKNAYPHRKIVVHSSVPDLYTNFPHKVKHTLYSWSVFETQTTVVRIKRMIDLLTKYVAMLVGLNHQFGNTYSQELINDYKNAELIVFAGGGYLRSKPGLTQTLNALMQLVMVEFAKLVSAPKIFAPISFGPYAYTWLEKLSAKSLLTLDLVTAREHYSFDKLKAYGLKNIAAAHDHALFLPLLAKKKLSQLTVGFTIRSWLPKPQQKIFENHYLQALSAFAHKHSLHIQPIVQVDAPTYGDDDFAITKRLVKKLKQAGHVVLPIQKPTSVSAALKVYSQLHVLLGMRMHANILAATQNVPFVAIAYEYKTLGICKKLGLSSVIKAEETSAKNLLAMLEAVFKKRVYWEKHLESKKKQIYKERSWWLDRFSKLHLATDTSLSLPNFYNSSFTILIIGYIWYTMQLNSELHMISG